MNNNRKSGLQLKCWWMALAVMAGLTGSVVAAPDSLVQSVTYDGETITMRLTKENLRGPHFELWSQNATGGYDVITALVDERSFMGTVDEYPGATSCGILLDDGTFKGAVYFARGGTWRTLGTAVTGTRALDYEDFTNYQFPTASSTTNGQIGTDMYVYDLAVDADFDYFTEVGSDIDSVLEGIEYSMCLVRTFYMHDALLQFRLGRVVVRATEAHDPYVGLSQGSYLEAFKAEWNTNHTDADRDLAMGLSPTKIAGGVAWVGTIGTDGAYSVNQSSYIGATGDFDVIFRHELGHTWSCGHFLGGQPEGYGIMGGNQPARFTGCEVYKVLQHRDVKIAEGGILDNMGSYTNINLAPYASLDAATVLNGASVTIDVLGNDHDANAHTFSIQSFDAISPRRGAVITLSSGTGPNGRDELIYGPASEAGTDYFLYTIVDSSGQTAIGVATINVEPLAESTVETDADSYVQNSSTHGTEATVIVKRVNDNPYDTYNRTGWIHFDISALELTEDVQLRLPLDTSSGSGASGNLRVWGIIDGTDGDALGTDWTETGINYWNAPVDIPFAEDAATTLIAEIACGDPGEDMLISSVALLAFLEADTNGEVTFVLSREVDNEALIIRSQESAGGGATLETFALLDADTYVRGGSYTNNNFGTATTLLLKNLESDPSYTRESFLRFVYSDITKPITSATLKLTLESKDADAGNVRIRLLEDADDYWDETSLTWDTMSEGSGTELSIPLSEFEAGVEYSIDVTTLLNQSINSNQAASFHLDIDAATAVTFHSRESTVALSPKLDLTTTNSPVAGAVTFNRDSTDTILKISNLQLLENSTDPNDSTLSVISVSSASTNGGTVSLSGNWITYVPPESDADDAFTFRISNADGYEAEGTVTVLIDTSGSTGSDLNIASATVTTSNVLIRIVGIPARTFDVQHATTLVSPDWETVGSTTIDSLGFVVFTNTPAPAGDTHFYRTIEQE